MDIWVSEELTVTAEKLLDKAEETAARVRSELHREGNDLDAAQKKLDEAAQMVANALEIINALKLEEQSYVA